MIHDFLCTGSLGICAIIFMCGVFKDELIEIIEAVQKRS